MITPASLVNIYHYAFLQKFFFDDNFENYLSNFKYIVQYY